MHGMVGKMAWALLVVAGTIVPVHAGLPPEAPRPERTPAQELVDAAGTGDSTTVDRLLDAGVAIDAGSPVTGATALHQAAAGGHAGLIAHLIRRGATVDAVDGDGATPLVYAAYQGREKAVAVLLEAGARVDVVPSRQVHALNAAVLSGVPGVVRRLVEAGAMPDLEDAWGKDARDYVAQTGRQELASLWSSPSEAK